MPGKQVREKPKAKIEARQQSASGEPQKVVNLRAKDLKPHPRQKELGDMRDDEFAALKTDIQQHGIQTPLQVMADRKTVIAGHQRLRACLQIGIKHVPCIVREALVDPHDPEVIWLLAADNLIRRQLTLLQKARHARMLADVEYQQREDTRFHDDQREREAIREAVGKKMGLDGRSVGRYQAVLRTPDEIQQAFDAGILPIRFAESVANLPEAAQDKIVEEIAKCGGEGRKESQTRLRTLVKDLVEEYYPKRLKLPPSPLAAVRQLVDFVHAKSDEILANISAILAELNPPEEISDDEFLQAFHKLEREANAKLKHRLGDAKQRFNELCARILLTEVVNDKKKIAPGLTGTSGN